MIPAANHLWQSTLFGAAAALAAFLLRGRPARLRHAIWLAASLKFLVPFSILVGAASQVAPRNVPAIVSRKTSAAIDDIAAYLGPAAAPAPSRSHALPLIWACGLLALSCRSIIRWRRAGAIVRHASPVPLTLPLEVRSSPAVAEPGIFGILHPVLLLPEGIADRLSPAQLRAMLAHEMCHVRRHDNLAALLQMAVEAIFWFHPLVWFIGARLIEERELACDEEVLRQGNQPEIYAGGILAACRICLESRPAFIAAAGGADLRKRIERILTDRSPLRLGPAGTLLLAICGFAAIAGPVAIGLLHAQARPAFEVASVKLNRSGDRMGRLGPVDRGRFVAVNIPLPGLVMAAYDVNFQQVSGWPEWAQNERFDVEAKSDHPVGRQETNAMLQTLLEERFHLVLRRETREQPIYALVADKGSSRLKAHAAATTSGETLPIRPGDKGQVIFNGVAMDRLAWFLGIRLGRRVLDQTGLTGVYDFELDWDGPAREERAEGGPPPEPGPSVFAALHDLGLKLESRKGPVEFLIIQHLEHPSEN
jgi:uncharacterized protein (TIGR03435 family)